MAEENSGTIGSRSRALAEELRRAVKTEDIEAVEHKVATWLHQNKLLRSQTPAEFIKPSIKSMHSGIGRVIFTNDEIAFKGDHVKAAS